MSRTVWVRSMVTLALGLVGTAAQVSGQTVGEPQVWPALQEVDDRSKIAPRSNDDRICFALYTLSGGVLKLSVQMYPLAKIEPHEVTLELERGGSFTQVADARAHPTGWSATFRVEGWQAREPVRYRVKHPLGSVYEGLIRPDPVGKNVIVAAAFTGNSPGPGGGKISKQDVVDSVKHFDPDVLLFTGDQVYNHTAHTQHWIEFGEMFGQLTRNCPAVTIPDDHDIGQPNMWGAGGRKTDLDTKGGYTRPAGYVQMVERQQTAHLPDPYDPTAIEQGVGVYYTSMNVGGIDFAILEDRKFKSGCFDFDIKGKGFGPRPDHVLEPGIDPQQFDVAGKKLLGDRQLAFLDAWARNWKGVVMKAAVSQTVFSAVSTHGGRVNGRYYMDFDANGWPQTGRDRAIDAIRRCFAFHICGDQHLATLGQYGIDEHRDGGWWMCVPSIANLYPRWWAPETPPSKKVDGPLDHLGDYVDGFGNKVTIHAHTNPRESGREPKALHDRMPGFGIVSFDKSERTITINCWPRMVDVTDEANQYPGWPRTIAMTDNYPQEGALGTLGPVEAPAGVEQPVVRVTSEDTGELVYALRTTSAVFEPWVFEKGKYTVEIGDPDQDRWAKFEHREVRPR